MRDIGTLRKMTELHITGCALMSDRAITTTPGTLRKLCAGSLPHLSEEGVLTIARRNTLLHELDLSHSCEPESLGSEAVSALVAGCPELERLDLTGCVSASGQASLQKLGEANECVAVIITTATIFGGGDDGDAR